MEDIFAFLAAHDISYERADHPAVFTCEQARQFVPPLPGLSVKNLFLRDERGDRHYLVIVSTEKSVDLKALSKAIDTKKLSFASPERLKKYLGIEPGSVSLLALVHDRDHAVSLVLDTEAAQAESLHCHPLVNTSTLVIHRDGIARFLRATGHVPRVVAVPSRLAP